MKIFKRNSFQEMVEAEIETDLTAGVETIQGTTIELEIEITTIGIEVEIVETIEVEVEIGLIPEKEEETNQDLDQVKDTLTEMKSAVIATDLVMQCITVLNWRTI